MNYVRDNGAAFSQEKAALLCSDALAKPGDRGRIAEKILEARGLNLVHWREQGEKCKRGIA
jgi:hypothetical protein